jgi:hypothetical protein
MTSRAPGCAAITAAVYVPRRRRGKPRPPAAPGTSPTYPEGIGRVALRKRESYRYSAGKAMPAAAPGKGPPYPEEGIGGRRRRKPHSAAVRGKSPSSPEGMGKVARQRRRSKSRSAAKALPAQGKARTRTRETRARQCLPRTPGLTATNKNNQEPHYTLVICWRLRASYCYNSFRERSVIVCPRESCSPS